MNGNKVKDNIPMKVYTIYVVKLDNLLEFNDLNCNGIADFIRTGDGLNRTSIQPIEPIYKGVSLKTAWNASGEKSSSDPANKSKSYEITISAKDQSYVKLNNSGNVTGVLDKLAFTFHLTAKLVHVDNATLPHFDVTVQQGMGGHRYGVVSAQRTGTVTVNGNVGKYAVKWDHLIEGWDFDPANTNKSLLLEFQAIVGNFVPDQLIDIARCMQNNYENGEASYTSDSGHQRVSEDGMGSDWQHRPGERLKMPRVDFQGNWTRVGWLTWTSNVEVDGQAKQMYAQIQGGRRVMLVGPMGLFAGFGLLGGLSYPGGDKIFHDPSVESDMMLYTESAPVRGVPAGLFLIGAIVIVVMIGAIAYARMKGLGPFYRKFDDTYDRPEPRDREPRNDWDRHYKK
jgi:hypothetical protein